MKTTNFAGIILPHKKNDEKFNNIITTRKMLIEQQFPFVKECVRRRINDCKEALELANVNNAIFQVDENAAYHDDGHFSLHAYNKMQEFLSAESWAKIDAFGAQQAAKAIRKYSSGNALDISFEVAMEICLCGKE
jgi:hypothetical protein